MFDNFAGFCLMVEINQGWSDTNRAILSSFKKTFQTMIAVNTKGSSNEKRNSNPF